MGVVSLKVDAVAATVGESTLARELTHTVVTNLARGTLFAAAATVVAVGFGIHADTAAAQG